MLKIINEELMAYSTVVTEEKSKNGSVNPITKISICNTNKVVAFVNENDKNRRDTEQVPLTKGAKIISVSNEDNVEIKSVRREICRVSAPVEILEDYTTQAYHKGSIDFYGAMTMNIDYGNNRQPKVEIKCHEDGDDRANLYIIAFPFNGKMKPLKEDPRYRIHKGVLVTSSAKPFYFNSRRYRKVLYLIVEINKNLFDENHKYHTDNIDIKLESFRNYTDRETGKDKTTCEEFILNITSSEGDYETEWNYTEADERIVVESEPGQQMWVTYKRPNTKYNDNNNKSYENKRDNNEHRKPKYKSQKPSHIEGDMVVTTNRHGIRKEIPMKAGKGYIKRSYNDAGYSDFVQKKHHAPERDFESLLRDSGIYEEDDYSYPRSKKKSKNKSMKNKYAKRY